MPPNAFFVQVRNLTVHIGLTSGYVKIRTHDNNEHSPRSRYIMYCICLQVQHVIVTIPVYTTRPCSYNVLLKTDADVSGSQRRENVYKVGTGEPADSGTHRPSINLPPCCKWGGGVIYPLTQFSHHHCTKTAGIFLERFGDFS